MADVTPVPWTCKLSKLDAHGNPAGDLGEQAITVGEKILVSCEGADVDINTAKLSLEVPEKAKYALRILEVRTFSGGHGEFVATTWVGASSEFKQLILTDGSTKIDLGPLKLNVQSVIPQEKQQKPEAFEPYGPMKLGLPLYVWFFILVVVLAVGSWAAWLGISIIKQRRLKRLLAKNQIALSPFNHFNKELRRLVRGGMSNTGLYVTELRDAFRWYLARELVVPAVSETPKVILKTIGRKHPEVFKEFKRDLTLALTELEKSLHATGAVSEADLTQMTELCRSIADRLELQKKKRRA